MLNLMMLCACKMIIVTACMPPKLEKKKLKNHISLYILTHTFFLPRSKNYMLRMSYFRKRFALLIMWKLSYGNYSNE